MNLKIILPAVVIAVACTLAGCKTQSAMTAKSTECGTISIDIVASRYSREGSTTVWCAKCKNKLYLCVSNPDRSRIECKEATADMCE